MVRVADRPIATFTPDEPTRLPWPTKVHLLFESESIAEVWDEPGITWDDEPVKWDQPNLPGQMRDVSCDLAGIDIEHGPPDASELFPAGSMAATLVDPDGRYSRYTPDGALVTWQIGKRCSVLADDGTEWWWLFHGRITAWNDQADGTVEVEAFNLPHELDAVGPFTAGANGQNVAQRIAAILPMAFAVDVVTRLAPGTVALTAQPTERTPLEEMQVASTMSDGGLLFADADDALVYFDRDWRNGRSDQTRTWVISDNDCTADAVVWNLRLLTSDEGLATAVRLENVAGLVAATQLALNPYQVSHTLTYSEPGQWTTQAQGDALAAHQLEQRSVVLVDVDELQLYVHDPAQDLWALASDLRIGDLMLLRHNYRSPGGDGQLTVGMIVNLIRHSINPSEWVTTIGAWTHQLPPDHRWQIGQWQRSRWATGAI